MIVDVIELETEFELLEDVVVGDVVVASGDAGWRPSLDSSNAN